MAEAPSTKWDGVRRFCGDTWTDRLGVNGEDAEPVMSTIGGTDPDGGRTAPEVAGTPGTCTCRP